MAISAPSLSTTVGNLQIHHWHDPSHTVSRRTGTYLGLNPVGGASTADLAGVTSLPVNNKN